ncbi:hypothetical protein ANN_08064 [Periplaneta americana]|uniref:Uncharacterized protein n=1 Tax=Periplaneta americana TaxID=6978 RepID=A0ABQ8T0C0_PERAM|nr:hypothetical protein ANN_08064 [Periplaneta americana]
MQSGAQPNLSTATTRKRENRRGKERVYPTAHLARRCACVLSGSTLKKKSPGRTRSAYTPANVETDTQRSACKHAIALRLSEATVRCRALRLLSLGPFEGGTLATVVAVTTATLAMLLPLLLLLLLPREPVGSNLSGSKMVRKLEETDGRERKLKMKNNQF